MKPFISKTLGFVVVTLSLVGMGSQISARQDSSSPNIRNQPSVTNQSAAASPNQASEDDADGPIVEYETANAPLGLSTLEDQVKRHSKNGRYDRAQPTPIKELQGEFPLPLTSHWWLNMPGIPVSKSDAIVLGTVTDSRAYLSNDKSGVYSEFQLSADQILKDSTKSLVLHGNVVAIRFGGIVRFADGKTQKYSIAMQGWPRKGRRYVLFLRRNEYGDFDIVTGYELRDGITFPLDGSNRPGANETPFHAYSGMSEVGFLEAVQKAVKTGSSQ
jgi:hypothetical protein